MLRSIPFLLFDGNGVNISQEGLALLSPQLFRQGSYVKMKIKSKNGLPQFGLAEVQWSRPHLGSSFYEAGLRFISLFTEADDKAVKRFYGEQK